MEHRLIRLRYSGRCSQCAGALPAGTNAWWNPESRETTCVACCDGATTTQSSATDAAHLIGDAGASARGEYERRHDRRETAIERRWGRFAGIAKFLSDDPQSTKAWAKGSDGERRLAASLLKRVGDTAVLLHDRKIPGTRTNIDHLAIAPSGIWVIDAKTYKGLVERRDRGGWFTTDHRLFVGGRDRTRLCDGLAKQVDAVRRVVSERDVPVYPVLCFVDAEWRRFAKPFELQGITVTWGKRLAEMIGTPGTLSRDVVFDIANRLATSLPPAVA